MATIPLPVDIPLTGNILDFSLGKTFIHVLFKEGHVRSWGSNFAGQLALGHTETIGDNEPISFARLSLI